MKQIIDLCRAIKEDNMKGSRENLSELNILYKFMILYMLERADQPVSKTQIYDFMLSREYTDYFTVNEVINEMIDTGFIKSQTKRNRSHLELTDEGRKILVLFPSRIKPEIKKEIDDYLLEKEYDLKNEVSIQSNYYKGVSGDYIAELTAREKNSELMTIRVSVPSAESAESVCLNWERNNQEIYKALMQKLL
ncbi:MAG: DUF4364 family protein [Lachnospiraceae bacterium]|nr:DUF4364 family protein [Lachnospiraceae bacterium]